ncbi:hypothetical protein KKJFFJLC_00002 [Vibrio phage vB_VpaS_PGB]|nr:hypothetical protein HHKILHMN_00034 [Vibrio phage vB_VpaS_PGA]WVH05545.1 hypothetical protein KKJFFJLC_00002 [Vibrio phage vB_VpaS_PGB]
MDLIEPKEIELTSEVRKVTKTLRVGYYQATEGIRLLGLFAETVDIAARKKTEDVNGMFGENLKKAAIEICKYVEVKLENGNWLRLDNEPAINAHILDYEMLLRLVREVHDYNSNFFNSGRLLKTSQGLIDRLKAQVTKTLPELLESYLAKNKRRSKS